MITISINSSFHLIPVAAAQFAQSTHPGTGQTTGWPGWWLAAWLPTCHIARSTGHVSLRGILNLDSLLRGRSIFVALPGRGSSWCHIHQRQRQRRLSSLIQSFCGSGYFQGTPPHSLMPNYSHCTPQYYTALIQSHCLL